VAPLGCITTGPEVCFNARDDNCNGPIDEGCGVESGFLQFIVAWDQADADVDLLVIDPNGAPATVGKELRSGLTKDRDCPGEEGACGGNNIENVFSLAGEGSARGKYVVKVRLERWDGLEDPVRINLGARLGPKTFATEFQLAREKQERRFELTL
jgi:tRNA (guanosine-2'-O-)-methyltransferase